VGLKRFQRRAEEVSLLIREAFLRGISTRQVGRVVATITGETVSAQTVSKLTRDLDQAVRQFHQAHLSDDYVYIFGWSELAGAATGGPQAGADAGGLWHPVSLAYSVALQALEPKSSPRRRRGLDASTHRGLTERSGEVFLLDILSHRMSEMAMFRQLRPTRLFGLLLLPTI
jgi:hypothetical protein